MKYLMNNAFFGKHQFLISNNLEKGFTLEGDPERFIEAVLNNECAAIKVDGDKLRRALLDGAPWHALSECYGAETVQGAVDEILEVLSVGA